MCMYVTKLLDFTYVTNHVESQNYFVNKTPSGKFRAL